MESPYLFIFLCQGVALLKSLNQGHCMIWMKMNFLWSFPDMVELRTVFWKIEKYERYFFLCCGLILLLMKPIYTEKRSR